MDIPATYATCDEFRPSPRDVLASVLLCPLLPATATRRTLTVSLWTAFWIHLLFAVGCVAVVLAAIAWEELPLDADFFDFRVNATKVALIFLDMFVAYPLPSILSVVGVEMGVVGLSVWLLPWGACDEPLKESFRHALRRVWMQTPQLFLFFILAASTMVFLDRADRHWTQVYGLERPDPPVFPLGALPGAPQWNQYNQQMNEHWEEIQRIEEQEALMQPLHIRIGQPLAAVNCMFLGLLHLVSLLRSGGVVRRSPPHQRQPLCENCGYDLTATPLESRCPECGEPAIDSLGPDARPGPPWANRKISRLSAWAKTASAAIFSPTAFGRMLRVTDHGTIHRSFLFAHLPLIFLVGAVAPPVLVWIVEGRRPNEDFWEIALFVGAAAGFMCVTAVTSLVLKSAVWPGFYHWWKLRRNLLPASMQMTCYLTPFLLFWEIVGGASGIFLIKLANTDAVQDWFKTKRLDSDAILLMIWFVINIIFAIIYGAILKRGVTAARFANR